MGQKDHDGSLETRHFLDGYSLNLQRANANAVGLFEATDEKPVRERNSVTSTEW